MNDRTIGPDFANQSSNKSGASKAFEGAAKFAAGAAEEIKQSASETVSGLGDHLRQIMDSQVESGAAAVSTLANSIHTMASDLDQQSAQIGKFAHLAADRLDQAAGQLQDKTAEQLLRDVSDFTKKRPALVFSAAALAGFFVLRIYKSATVNSPSIQPERDLDQRASEFHGV